MSEQGKNRAEYDLGKVALEGGLSQKIDVEAGRANEWSQNPTELAAEKEITCEPREKDPSRNLRISTQLPQKVMKPQVAGDSGASIDAHVHELNEAVGGVKMLTAV